jgi:outer membrane protein assembly factor BamA
VQKKIILKLSCLFLFSLSFFTPTLAETNEKRDKKGLSFVVLPILSFDSDLGIQYGLLGNLYNFGDGTRYPKYDHSLYVEFSRYTKGSQLFQVSFISDRIIKNVDSRIDIMYLEDMLAYFYGYNGYNAVYNKENEKINRAFYQYQNKSFRIKPDFQGTFNGTHFGWGAGLNLIYVNPGSVDVSRINADKTNSVHNLPDDPNLYLYNKYVNWGIISSEETKKKWLNYFNLSIKYDTRDYSQNPFSGIFTEVVVEGAPGFLFNDFPHSKFAFIHRQYVPIIKKRLNVAYRLFYQTTVGKSQVPFYAQPLIIGSFESNSVTQGLGGGRTLRGVLRNRVVGDGFVMANVEFRLKLFQLTLFKQYFDVYTNPFIDAGYITKEVDISEQLSKLSEEDRATYFRNEKQQIHASGGLGFKLIMNDNFVLSLEAGKPFDKRDGDEFRLYLNMDYAF